MLIYGCFVLTRCTRYHCKAMRTLIKACINWHKIKQIEHTLASFRSSVNHHVIRLQNVIHTIIHSFLMTYCSITMAQIEHRR